MSVVIFYVLLATESESDISFAPSRLDFSACEVTNFRKQGENEKIIFQKQWLVDIFVIVSNVF